MCVCLCIYCGLNTGDAEGVRSLQSSCGVSRGPLAHHLKDTANDNNTYYYILHTYTFFPLLDVHCLFFFFFPSSVVLF